MAVRRKVVESMKESSFSKEQVINSGKYAGYKDALAVVLSDEKNYTIKEVECILDKFLKGKVK